MATRSSRECSRSPAGQPAFGHARVPRIRSVRGPGASDLSPSRRRSTERARPARVDWVQPLSSDPFAPVAAAARLRDRQALAAEVAALEADEADRAEMRAVAELMENSESELTHAAGRDLRAAPAEGSRARATRPTSGRRCPIRRHVAAVRCARGPDVYERSARVVLTSARRRWPTHTRPRRGGRRRRRDSSRRSGRPGNNRSATADRRRAPDGARTRLIECQPCKVSGTRRTSRGRPATRI